MKTITKEILKGVVAGLFASWIKAVAEPPLQRCGEKKFPPSDDQGFTAGVVTWALTHGSTVPALGLQGKVSEMPKSWWVWEFGSHIIFGVAMEQSRKLLNRIF